LLDRFLKIQKAALGRQDTASTGRGLQGQHLPATLWRDCLGQGGGDIVDTTGSIKFELACNEPGFFRITSAALPIAVDIFAPVIFHHWWFLKWDFSTSGIHIVRFAHLAFKDGQPSAYLRRTQHRPLKHAATLWRISPGRGGESKLAGIG